MKAFDILLILCAIAFLAVSYFVYRDGSAEMGALVSLVAILCGVAFGARMGGRLHKKNKENK